MSGTHRNVLLIIPDNERPQQDSLFWVQVIPQSDISPSGLLSIELQLLPNAVSDVVQTLEITRQQTNDGSKIEIAHLAVSDLVTLSLHFDENGAPGQPPLTSTTVVAGDYRDLSLLIPEANRTGVDSIFWVEAQPAGQITASQGVSVSLLIAGVPALNTTHIVSLTSMQTGDPARVVIERLVVTTPVTVSLFADSDGAPASTPLTYTVLPPNNYDNLALVIPDDSRPVQPSWFWIKTFALDSVTATDSISVALNPIYSTIGRVVVDSTQLGSGSYIDLSMLEIYTDELWVGILGSDLAGIGPDYRDVKVQQPIPGPARLWNRSVFFSMGERLSGDTRLWIQLYKSKDDPSGSPQKVDYVLRTVVTDFAVPETQGWTSDVVSVSRLSASKPVTLVLQDRGANFTSTLELPGMITHENVLLPIPKEWSPARDTQYTVQLYVSDADTITMPQQVKTTLLDLPPLVDIDLSTRQKGDGSKLTIDRVQTSEPVRITLHLDEEQAPAEDELATANLPRPDTYRDVPFVFPDSLELDEGGVFWYRFFDDKQNEVHTPISVTLISDTSSKPELTVDDKQFGDGSRVRVAHVRSDIPFTLLLSNDSEGTPGEIELARRELLSGDYPNSLEPELWLDIPSDRRPITDTIYWLQGIDAVTNKAVADPVSVTLELLPVVADFEVESPQLGSGDVITAVKLNVSEQVTLELHSDVDGLPGPVIAQKVLKSGNYSGVPLVIPEDKRPATDSRYWVQIYSRRQSEAADQRKLELDLPTLIEREIAGEQINDGSHIEIAKLRVSEAVTASVFDENSLYGEPIVTQVFEPGSYHRRFLEFPVNGKPVTDTNYLLELTYDGNMALESPTAVTLTVQTLPPLEPSIQVRNQEREGLNAIFDHVTTPRDAWLAVYEQQAAGPQLVGVQRMPPGENSNVQVFFRRQVPRGAVLWAVLHEDTGANQSFDYPEADPPMAVGTSFAARPFVLAEPGIKVDDNQVISGSVTIREVIAPHDGWIAVYSMDQQQLLGYKHVPMGRTEGLSLPFNVSRPALGPAKLVAILHRKDETENLAQFPIPDSVSTVDGKSIGDTFNVTVEPGACGLTGSGYAYSGDQPLVVVADPAQLDGSVLRVQSVCLPDEGWIAVYRNAGGSIGDTMGYAKLPAGSIPAEIPINLSEPRPFGQPIWIVLHADKGQVGVFELPEPDLPIWINGKPAVFYAMVGQPPPQNK